MQIKKYWLRGGLIGLGTTLFLFGTLSVFTGLNIELSRFPLTALSVFAAAILEFPVAIIARSLGFPIETGKAAFIIYQFNALGYFLTVVFWTLVGALMGWLIGKKRC